MAFELPKINYTGEIKEIELGQEDKKIPVGGEKVYPFCSFEGEMPHPPGIAMEVLDIPPENWPQSCLEPFKGVVDKPGQWAKKCVEEYKAEMVCLHLEGIDPDGKNRGAEDTVKTVKEVIDSIEVPLIVWGCEKDEKDAEVLRKVAEEFHGKNLILGPVVENNYKKLGAAAIAFNHTIIASTPIDVNLAKQLNILLGDLGVPDEKILMDPNRGGSSLGYGAEYTYSVMERDKVAALTQGDKKLAFPIICNIASQVWKNKEAKISQKEEPKMGEENRRGVMLEAVTASMFLVAGANILIMRHPESVKLMKNLIEELSS
ncbi:MAG TPA: acetyl-CoA decarbonylase/synthase complex subunit delta [Candidatus Omnitrophica bacterium]|nr:acetyl-CoA decarbonylase/synthase complex subunit delta [Candidatus Omnitrophota bacterium]